MNRDQYEARVRNLEAYARLHPRLYLWRVGLLAAVGYLYLGLVLVLLGLGTIPIVVMVAWHPNYLTIKLAVVLLPITLGLSWIILRALWIRLDPPQGLAIHPPDAPALFAELGELTRRLDAPRFHQVLLNGEFNASVVQIPRLGPLGWHKNYLSLGLPLLEGLAPAEFQAVLAHELAHLSRNHSRFSGWIYRVRQAWNRVFESLATKAQSGAGLLVKFFQWYAPYFNAYSFVLARANEYEADRCACSLTSPQALAQSLIRTQIHSRQLSEAFWPSVYRQVRFQAAPPERVFHQLAENLGQPPPPEHAARWLGQALAVDTNNSDTHPCLRDRLRAAGCAVAGAAAETARQAVPPELEATAARHYFGAGLEALRARLEQDWATSLRAEWRARHEEAATLRQQLEELEAKAASAPLAAAEQWTQAQLVLNVLGEAAALPLLHSLMASSPGHAGAHFLAGRILVERDEEAGVACLEKAMDLEPEAVAEGCNLLYGFFQRTGRQDRLKALTERYDRHAAIMEAARQERASVTHKDHQLPHGLPPEAVQALCSQLRGCPEVEAAWLARKEVQHLPDSPYFLLLIKPRHRWYAFRSSSADQALVNKLVAELSLPGPTLVYIGNQNLAALGKKTRRVAGSAIYPGRPQEPVV